MMRKAAAHKKNRETKKGAAVEARAQNENEETAQRQVTVTSDASLSPENHARAGGPNKVSPPCVANKVQRQTAGGNESKPEKKGSQERAAQRQVTATSDASHSPENHARAGGPNKVLPPCVANKVQRQIGRAHV